MAGMARDQYFIRTFPWQIILTVGQVSWLQGRIDKDFILFVRQFEQLSMTETKSPVIFVVRSSVRDPIRMLRKSKYVLFQHGKRNFLLDGNTIVHHMKIGFLEIDNSLTSSVFYICISN